jgi:HEAT repeat protein
VKGHKLFRFNRPFGTRRVAALRDAEDVDGLIEALKASQVKRSAGLRAQVVRSLGKLQAVDAVQRLSELLRSDPSKDVRIAAAIALGEVNDPSALPALRDVLGKDSDAVQLWAIRSIGQLRDRLSVTVLIGMLQSPDWGRRSYAAGALGEIGDHAATEGLIAKLDDPNSTVRMSVVAALEELGDSRAVGPIREAAKHASFMQRPRFRAAADGLEQRFGS